MSRKKRQALLIDGDGDDSPLDFKEDEVEIVWDESAPRYDNLLNAEGENSLMQGALELMDRADQTSDAVRAKKVGLSLISLAHAEVHALRLVRAACTAAILEEKLFNIENIKRMTKPSQIAEHLAILNATAADASKNIRQVLGKSKELAEAEEFLRHLAEASLEPEVKETDRTLTKAAVDLLTKLSSGSSPESLLIELDEIENQELQ